MFTLANSQEILETLAKPAEEAWKGLQAWLQEARERWEEAGEVHGWGSWQEQNAYKDYSRMSGICGNYADRTF